MLSMALELAAYSPEYVDVASKFFEHFVAIAVAINTFGGTGLWDDLDGFYYDQLHVDGRTVPMRIRSIVGLIPLFAVEVLEDSQIDRLPGFKKRMEWFLHHRPDLAKHITYCKTQPSDNGHEDASKGHRLLALPSLERLQRVLKYLLDENEFLSPYGVRSLSRVHKDRPFVLHVDGQEHRVDYEPAESMSGLFGGNSNWRGPIWMPINFLLIEALERYHHFYGNELTVECPTGSGRMLNLKQVAHELSTRISRIFLPDDAGKRPCHGGLSPYCDDPLWSQYPLFYEYFDGDTGRGCGASHQTGWTSLVAKLLRDVACAPHQEKIAPSKAPRDEQALV
jgi:hypothetical protein